MSEKAITDGADSANGLDEDSPSLISEVVEGFVRVSFVDNWSGQDDRAFRNAFMDSFFGLLRETKFDLGKFEPDSRREAEFTRGFWKTVDTWKKDRDMTVGVFVRLCVGYSMKFFGLGKSDKEAK